MKKQFFIYSVLLMLLLPSGLKAQMTGGGITQLEKTKPIYEWEQFTTAGVSHSMAPVTSLNLRYGAVKRFGGYIALKTNFIFFNEPDGYNYDYYYNDNIFWSGEYFNKRWSVTGGGIVRLSPHWGLYAGVGYGEKIFYAKNLTGKVIEIYMNSTGGIEPELGLMYKTGRFVMSAGINTMADFDYSEINIGFGISF